MGGFATTLTSVSLVMMQARGVTNQTVLVADLCFVACVALLISAQWDMVRGQTFSYTVLSAYGTFLDHLNPYTSPHVSGCPSILCCFSRGDS